MAEADREVNVADKLSDDDKLRLAALLREMSSTAAFEQSLDGLISRWCNFGIAVQRGYDDSIYEYINDLGVRDLLERVGEQLSEEGREILMDSLRPCDDKLLAETKEICGSLIKPSPGEMLGWWYYRIPTKLSGELLDDLQNEGLV